MKNKVIVIILLSIGSLIFSDSSIESTKGKFNSTLSGKSATGTFEFNLVPQINGFKFIQKNTLYESETLFDKDYKFKSIKRIIVGVDPVNEDYYFAELSKNKKELFITYKLKGQTTETKKLKVRENFRIFNNLYITLQNDLKGGEDDFEALLIFPEMASSYKASFKFYKTKNVLENNSAYKNIPNFFSLGSDFNKEVIVCQVGLTGIPGKFYPHKFSFIFENSDEYRFLGYWGGDPEFPNYYLTTVKGEDDGIN